jgi:integrase
MPPAVNRSALALYSHRLVEDGCRFRLHASPDKSPYLYVREIVDGERLRQFSLAPLEWVAREDVISAYERCLAGHELGRWPEQDKADTSSSISWETLAEETIAWLQQRRPRSLGTYRTYLRQIGQLRGKPRTQALREWACQADPASRGFTVRIDTLARIRDWGSSLVSDSLLSELRALRPSGKERRRTAREANRPRAIPALEDLQSWLDGIRPRPLQWALAMVATYGLRPHEVFHLECLPDAEGWIQIGGAERTKTGFRPVMPAPLAWVERYGLRENLAAELPWQPQFDANGTCLNNQYLGGQLGRAMRLRLDPLTVVAQASANAHRRATREILQCVPYDLRHAWAIRLASDPAYAHISTETAAEMMGHSRDVHKEIYLFWITKDEIQRGIKARTQSMAA